MLVPRGQAVGLVSQGGSPLQATMAGLCLWTWVLLPVPGEHTSVRFTLTASAPKKPLSRPVPCGAPREREEARPAPELPPQGRPCQPGPPAHPDPWSHTPGPSPAWDSKGQPRGQERGRLWNLPDEAQHRWSAQTRLQHVWTPRSGSGWDNSKSAFPPPSPTPTRLY